MARKKKIAENEAEIKSVDSAPENTELVEEIQEVQEEKQDVVEEDKVVEDNTTKDEESVDGAPENEPIDEDVIVYKTYQLKDQFHLSFNLDVNGKTVRVIFGGGIKLKNYQTNGKYSTSNTEIQKALESDKYFNKKYFIKREQKYKKNPEVTVAEQRLPDKTIVEGITTTQQAKEWMLNKFQSLASENMKNRKTILATAEKLNVSFPKLK